MTRNNSTEKDDPASLWGILAILAKSSPTAVALLAMAALFVYQDNKRLERSDLVNQVRIDACHSVQSQTITALEEVRKTLVEVQRALLMHNDGDCNDH